MAESNRAELESLCRGDRWNFFIRTLARYAGDEAEDLAQAAVMVMLRKLHMCRGGCAFFTWAATVARNHWLDWLKVRATASRNMQRAAVYATIEDDVLGRMIDRESRLRFDAALPAALESLNERRRMVILLRMAGVRRKDIAARAGLASESVAHNLLNAAVAEVRDKLEKAGAV